MELDLSKFPEPPATYEEAIAKIQKLIEEGEIHQRRLAELNNEVSYYQGIARVLEAGAKKSSSTKQKGA